ARDLLLNNLQLDKLRENLTRQQQSVAGLVSALRLEQQTAAIGKARSDLELSTAERLLADLQQQIERRRDELEQKTIDWSGLVTFAFVALAIGVITLGTGGTAAAALLPLAPDLLSLAGIAIIDSSVAEQER